MARRILSALLFDLDETLYPPETGLLAAGDRLITEYLARRLNLSLEEADAERRRLWRQYGTTARGAEMEYGIPQKELYQHSVEALDPRQYLAPDEALAQMLQSLPAELYVITNSIASYAKRVLEALGIAPFFSRIFDIEALGWRPKPDPDAYQSVLQALQRPAAHVGLVEDFPWNLTPARALGMFTIYLGTQDNEADVQIQHLLQLPDALKKADILLQKDTQ